MCFHGFSLHKLQQQKGKNTQIIKKTQILFRCLFGSKPKVIVFDAKRERNNESAQDFRLNTASC